MTPIENLVSDYRESTPTDPLQPIHWLAIVLVAITGLIHVYAGFVEGRVPVALAGIGFLAAIGLFLLGARRRLLYAVGVVYTAVQIPLWYVAKAGEFTSLGYADKAVQVAVVVVLVSLYWRAE